MRGTSKGNVIVQRQTVYAPTLLKLSQHRRLRAQEAPSSKGTFITLDDPENSDEPTRKNKGIPDGRKMEKDKVKKKIDSKNIDEKHLQAKMAMTEKK